jgi:hypothetical protein
MLPVPRSTFHILLGTLAATVFCQACEEPKPCPPPMGVCVGSKEEADRRNAEYDPACRIYGVCSGDAGSDGDAADGD